MATPPQNITTIAVVQKIAIAQSAASFSFAVI
jgi:hypothetical protein